MAAGPCINRYDFKIDRCFNQLNTRLSAIRQKKITRKLGYLCCEYQVMLECFQKTFVGTSCEEKTEASVDFLTNVMDNLISTNCGEYSPDGDKCQNLAPLNVKGIAIGESNVILNVALLFEESDRD